MKLLKSLLTSISYKIAIEWSSTTFKEPTSSESSYKANEYLCAEVFENPLFLLNFIILVIVDCSLKTGFN